MVIPADRDIRYARAGTVLTATNDLYLVPPARMREILRVLGEPAPTPATPAP